MPEATHRRPATKAEARALSHPLRLRILRLCLYEAMTNKQLADALDADPASTLYHVRTLVRTDFLEAGERRRGKRGSREIPYRATGKSWTLDVGADESVVLATLDAYRAELLAAGPDDVLSSTRIGVRVDSKRLATFRRRLKRLVRDLVEADDPSGEPISVYVGIHRSG